MSLLIVCVFLIHARWVNKFAHLFIGYYEIFKEFERVLYDNMIYAKLLQEGALSGFKESISSGETEENKDSQPETFVDFNKTAIEALPFYSQFFQTCEDSLTLRYESPVAVQQTKKKRKKKKKKQNPAPALQPEEKEDDLAEIKAAAAEALKSAAENVKEFAVLFAKNQTNSRDCNQVNGGDIPIDPPVVLVEQKVERKTAMESPDKPGEEINLVPKRITTKPQRKKLGARVEKKALAEENKERVQTQIEKTPLIFTIEDATSEYAQLKEKTKQKYAEITGGGIPVKKNKSRKKKTKPGPSKTESAPICNEIIHDGKETACEADHTRPELKVPYAQDEFYWEWAYSNYAFKSEFLKKLRAEINNMESKTDEYMGRIKPACEQVVKTIQSIAKGLFNSKDERKVNRHQN